MTQIQIESGNEINIILPECSLVNSFSLIFSIDRKNYNIIYDCENSTGDLTIKYFRSIFYAEYTNYYQFLLDSSDESTSNEYHSTTYLSPETNSESSIISNLSSTTTLSQETLDISSSDSPIFNNNSTEQISDNSIQLYFIYIYYKINTLYRR